MRTDGWLLLAGLLAAMPVGAEPLELRGERVAITLAPELMANEEKVWLLRKSAALETVYAYLDPRLEKLKLPVTTHVEVILTGFDIGVQGTWLTADAVLRDRGKELMRDEFDQVTGRPGKKRRITILSRALGMKVFEWVQGYTRDQGV